MNRCPCHVTNRFSSAECRTVNYSVVTWSLLSSTTTPPTYLIDRPRTSFELPTTRSLYTSEGRSAGHHVLSSVYQCLIYASSSWWGFTTASDRQRLEGFLRRGCRQNLYSTDKPSIAQIVEEADENLFNSIRYNPSHLLHQLLPRRTESSYSLRSRLHNFELSHVHDDGNFIDRMLFTARCTLVQSAVFRSHVVCPSVRPSVCDVGELWSHRLEFFENNFTIS